MELTANEKFKSLAKLWDLSTIESLEKPILKYGNFLYLQSKSKHTGKIGEDLSIKCGKTAARGIAMDFIAIIHHELGSMDKIKRVIGINGKINCASDFNHHSYIIKGCSELLDEVWGTKSKGVMASTTTADVWNENTSLEIEVLFELNN